MRDREIHINAINNNIKELEKSIENGIDIDALGEYDSTPLHYACREGHLEAVNLLIKGGANVNAKNDYSTIYPIFEAINSVNNQENYFLIIQSLIEGGADIDKVDSFGNTLLHHAIEKENRELIELLIQLGCDVNHGLRHDKDSALHYACFKKNREIISILINSGANQEHLNIYNKTPRDYL